MIFYLEAATIIAKLIVTPTIYKIATFISLDNAIAIGADFETFLIYRLLCHHICFVYLLLILIAGHVWMNWGDAYETNLLGALRALLVRQVIFISFFLFNLFCINPMHAVGGWAPFEVFILVDS
jgi:hypothetical protein